MNGSGDRVSRLSNGRLGRPAIGMCDTCGIAKMFGKNGSMAANTRSSIRVVA